MSVGAAFVGGSPCTRRTTVSSGSFIARMSSRASWPPGARTKGSSAPAGYASLTGPPGLRAGVGYDRLVDPVGIRLLERPAGQAGERVVHAGGEAAHPRVRERHRALEPRPPHELDGFVRGGVRRSVREAELIRAETKRRADGRIEFSHRALAELLDRVVERPDALHCAVGKALRERAVAVVELLRRRP